MTISERGSISSTFTLGPLCKNREIFERFLENKIELNPMPSFKLRHGRRPVWKKCLTGLVYLICLSSPGRTNYHGKIGEITLLVALNNMGEIGEITLLVA